MTLNPHASVTAAGILLASWLLGACDRPGPLNGDAASESDAAGGAGNDAKSLEDRLAELAAKRQQDWTSNHAYWEVVYDGVDTPGDNVPGPFMWDNPVDDDWMDPYTLGPSVYLDQFRLNTQLTTPAPGFLTVDRTYGSALKTGSISRRDEWLDSRFTHAIYGVTLELRIKLLPASQLDALFVNYIANDCTISVALSGSTSISSLGAISSGSISGGNSNHTALDTTASFNTYRIVRGPGFTTYDVYLVAYANENDAQPAAYQKIHEGQCDSSFKVGSAVNIDFPYVQIGDNSNDNNRNAAFVLDFVRYRRDAVFPSSPLASVQSRTPVALPVSTTLGAVSGGYFGEVPINAAAVTALMGERVTVFGVGSSFGAVAGLNGVSELTTGEDSHSDVEVIHPLGLTDKGAFTIEARLKVLPASGPRGFRIMHMDTLGSVSLYVSPTQVETGLGTKPAGFRQHAMDTTDAFHTYRLVRGAGELYAHLYVDDDPVPVIVDQHLSAETESYGFASNPIVSFGGYKLFPRPFVVPVQTTTANVQIDFIRWYGTATAPQAPTP